MTSKAYSEMSLDELFAALQAAAICGHDVYVAGEPVARQHEWAEKQNAMQEEIRARGGEAESRYIPLLKAEHPAVRLAAALGLRDAAPDLAGPVLEDLSDGKYGGIIALNAGMGL